MNDEILAGLALAIGHGPPFTAGELAAVTQVEIAHARDLNGIESLPNLRILQLLGCDLVDLARLEACREMTLFDANASRLGDLEPLRAMSRLREISLRCTDTSDLAPLLDIDDLIVVAAIGCPLDATSRRDVAEELRSRHVEVMVSDEETWELTVALWEAGLDACFHESRGVHRLCAPGLSVTATPEAGQPAITPEQLWAELDAGTSIEQMYATYGPGVTAAPPATDEWDPLHGRERGSADDARRWLVGSELPDDLYRPLIRFVDDFPTLDYLRETDQLFAEIETRDAVVLPEWLKRVRRTIAAPYHDSGPVHLELPELAVVEFDVSGEFGVYEIRGPSDDAERRQTVELGGIYPVVSGGAGGLEVLAIHVDEPDDPALYAYHVSDLSERGDGVVARPALRHYVALFDLAVAVRLQDGTRVPRRERPWGDPRTEDPPRDSGPGADDDAGDETGESTTSESTTSESTTSDDAGPGAASAGPATDGPGMRLLAALTGMPATELATADGFQRGISDLTARLLELARGRAGSEEEREQARREFGALVVLLREHGIPVPEQDTNDEARSVGWTPSAPSDDAPDDGGARFRTRINDVLAEVVARLKSLRDDAGDSMPHNYASG